MNKYYFKRKTKAAQTEEKTAKKKTSKSKPNLVKKLDRVFALYIRLRDTMPNGYVRCISCGQIKSFEDVDCGHFHSRTHMATRFHEDNCHAECRYCLTPDALILTKDLKWKKLGSLKVGDSLFAFSENSVGRAEQRRHWETATITHLHTDIQDVYDVELGNGDHVKTTAEHKWLVRTRSNGCEWLATKDMWIKGYNLEGKKKTGPHTDRTTTTVCKPFEVIFQDESYESGWLSGMIDADGHLTQQTIHNPDGSIRYGLRVGVAQCDKYPHIQKELIRLIEKFTGNNRPCRQSMDKSIKKTPLKSNYPSWQYLVTGSNIEKVQFLMRVRPKKMEKLDIDKLGMVRSKYDVKVKSITSIGKKEIVVMETSTHTFIANGYMMHNCNRFSADHLIGYQRNLIQKIGQQRFDLLNIKAHSTCHFLNSELEEMIAHYTAEVKKLSSLKGIKVNL